jgi:hypothetical protein
MKKFLAALGALLLFTVMGVTMPAQAQSESPPPEVPQTCDAIPEVLGHEWQLQKRVREFVPAVEELSHQVYSYSKQEEKFKTEYHFAKFVRTKSKTYTQPVAAVKAQHYSWTGKKRDADNPPTVVPPHKDWQANTSHEPHGNEATWVNEHLHYTANSKGHASWFYFTPAIPGVPGGWSDWSEFGEWEKWLPEQHGQWRNTTDPVGSPQEHASWQDGNTKYYREWQVRHDGQTREVSDGFDTIYSGEVLEPLDAPWVLLDGYPKTVIDQEGVPAYYSEWSDWTNEGDIVQTDEQDEPEIPADTDLVQYRWEYVGTYVKLEAIPASWQYEDPSSPCFAGPEQPDPRLYSDRYERVTCEGVWSGYELYSIEYVYNPETREWVEGEPVLVESGEDKVRDLTSDELIENGCVTLPPPPKQDDPPEEDDPKEDDPIATRPPCETPDDLKNDPKCQRDDPPKRRTSPDEPVELAETGSSLTQDGLLALGGGALALLILGVGTAAFKRRLQD